MPTNRPSLPAKTKITRHHHTKAKKLSRPIYIGTDSIQCLGQDNSKIYRQFSQKPKKPTNLYNTSVQCCMGPSESVWGGGRETCPQRTRGGNGRERYNVFGGVGWGSFDLSGPVMMSLHSCDHEDMLLITNYCSQLISKHTASNQLQLDIQWIVHLVEYNP